MCIAPAVWIAIFFVNLHFHFKVIKEKHNA